MAASRPRRPTLPRGTDFTAPLYTVEQADIARELNSPQVALPVWQVLRSVLQWAREAPALRGDLFEPCAMEEWEAQLLHDPWEPEVRQALAVAVAELSSPPGNPEKMAHTCMCVADWALEHSHTSTGLAYAEAAALACPESPRFAWAIGRLLCAHQRPHEGGRWLNRAKAVAVRAKDREAQALAIASLGNLYYAQGDYQRAWRVLTEALGVAHKHQLREREGEILHDLCVVATWRGDLATAEGLAGEAFQFYRGGHPRLPTLAQDLATVLLERGQPSRALYLLRELPPHFDDSAHSEAHALASLARAAAACGDYALFDAAWADAWALGEDNGWTAHAAMELGLGASTLARWEQAETTLRSAYDIAVAGDDEDIQKRAEAALEAVALRRGADKTRDPINSIFDPMADPLVSGMVVSLRAQAPGEG